MPARSSAPASPRSAAGRCTTRAERSRASAVCWRTDAFERQSSGRATAAQPAVGEARRSTRGARPRTDRHRRTRTVSVRSAIAHRGGGDRGKNLAQALSERRSRRDRHQRVRVGARRVRGERAPSTRRAPPSRAWASRSPSPSSTRCRAAFGAWLQAKGCKKGTRVALMMPNILQYPVCLFGILRAGCTVVNVNPLYTARELEHQLKDSGAEVIVVVENFARTVQEVRRQDQGAAAWSSPASARCWASRASSSTSCCGA